MIVSVSRRTDIPAFYSGWFFKRLKEGYACALNPFNRKQAFKIPLDAGSVDCFVFWTKDPEPMLRRLNELEDYHYYFQITLTAYGPDVETNLRPKKEILHTIKELSERIGKDRVIWRYDPVFLNERYNMEFHRLQFDSLAAELAEYTEKCVFSFMDDYKKTKVNMRHLSPEKLDNAGIFGLAEAFAEVAAKRRIGLKACSEKADLSGLGIGKARCIDTSLISSITGKELPFKKDPAQRYECGCAKSVDLGAYDTCMHGCLYCYANCSPDKARAYYERHDPNSPLLTGMLTGVEKIILRKE